MARRSMLDSLRSAVNNWRGDGQRNNEYDAGDSGAPPPLQPRLERKQGDDRTDEQIRDAAAANLKESEQTGRRAIDSMIEEADSLLRNNRNTEEQRARELLGQIETAFGQAQRNADNDALRRGLARSSIAHNRSADIQTAGAEARRDAVAQNLDNLAQIDNQLDGLTAKRERALNDFDIAHAARLTQEINNLTDARTRANNEAMAFNNRAAADEARMVNDERRLEMDSQLNQSRLQNEALNRERLQDELNATRNAAERRRLQEELFASTFRELEDMSRRDARNEIRNNLILREQLTPSQFFRLYDRFGR